jgi:hypothetical protein
MIADRLVNDLMLVSVLVAGEGAASFASALEQAGAAAEVFGGNGEPAPGFDLAILLTLPDTVHDPDMVARVAALAQASDRLLLVPLPLRDDAAPNFSPTLPALTDWFEVFADLGFQPVVDFDADFVAAGAFLVDRGATAAESELAAFADRLQHGPPPKSRGAPSAADPEDLAELVALRLEKPVLEARIAELEAEVAEGAKLLEQEGAKNIGWDGLRLWVNHAVADASRDTEAALRRDLPRILALRGDDAPPLQFLEPEEAPPPPKKGFFTRVFGRRAKAPPPAPLHVLEDAALVRASKYFDAAWYIASTPELMEGERIDPVFHYVLIGTWRGADPGPYFESAAYLVAHPEAEGTCPLVHALRAGTLVWPPPDVVL